MKISTSEKMLIAMVLEDYTSNYLTKDKCKSSKLNNFRKGILHILERFKKSI